MKSSQWLTTVSNVVVILVACVLLFRPDGPIVHAFTSWQARKVEAAKVSALWPALSATVPRLDEGTASEVAVVEFSDYECSFCRVQHLRMQEPGGSGHLVGLVFRHYPLPAHPAAAGAARASICAERQGRFRAMHLLLFEEVESWRVDTNWKRLAEKAQVADLPAFTACLGSEETAARLAADRALGDSLGLLGTPTFVARDGMHMGLQDPAALTKMAAAN